MSQAGGILNITNSHNAIINWGSFSIGVNELTRFIQPSALSAVLNRVVGSDPSAILGSLQSNGRVFLINPNGIMFGSGAQINVAGLVASTLNISNDDFLNNRMRFTDGALAGGVVNQGNITGGSVYLIGNAVANKGLITSPNGEVVLAAGNSVELVNPGTPNLRVEVVAPANEARNLGTISAEAGRVGIYAGLIKQGGTISADSAVAEGGRIMLKSTRRTDLETSSVISARGRDGGRIEVLSDMASGQTNVEGVLNASALGDAGRGGFVETSAASVNVGASTTVNTTGSAASGRWMIDPEDFVISAGSASQTSSGIGADTLATNLATTPVEIYTAAYGGGIGNILVNSPVVWNSANGLYLYAHGDIIVAQTLANAGTGDIALLAGWNGNPFASFPVSGSGNINVNAPVTSGGTPAQRPHPGWQHQPDRRQQQCGHHCGHCHGPVRIQKHRQFDGWHRGWHIGHYRLRWFAGTARHS
jgi:filamentous hemagglutinin family protein